MVGIADQRTIELKKLLDFYEQERDKLYDQVANLQGQKERLDWAIRVINARVEHITKEEQQRAALIKQQNEAMESAREQGNVGVHPSERKGKLAERRKEAARKKEEGKDSSTAKKKVKKTTDEE